MAVDTRNRRAAVLNFALPFINLNPDPDGSLASAPDLDQMGHAYNGFALSSTLPAGRGRRRRHSLSLYSPLTPPYTTPYTQPILPWER